ncbi:porin [Paraferrimonas sp. SM1919]|uniref:porin n=1 Tax=Paraferrimonas sp. SM1919 TaxID=2662263 RepID=UPI0013D2B3EC|nr:porin [Paraferrimonas sp. SM1919]
MKHTKSLLTTAVLSALALPVSAVNLYKDQTNQFDIGGWLDARIVNFDGESQVVNGASRINFAAVRQMGKGWQSFAKFEWGVNPVGSSSLVYSSESRWLVKSNNFLSNRLGFAGIKHNDYGELSIGKQWSVWYDVVGGTNIIHVWDGSSAGTYTFKSDGGLNGSGRADNAVIYRLPSFYDFSLSFQTQLKSNSAKTVDVQLAEVDANDPNAVTQIKFEGTYGASLKYQATENLKLVLGANGGNFTATLNPGIYEDRGYIVGGSINYGNNWYNPGLYFSANLHKQQYHDVDNAGRIIDDAMGLESLISYTFDNKIRVLASYNRLEAGDEYKRFYQQEFKRQFMAAGVHYIWDQKSKTTLYFEVKKDFSSFKGINAEIESQAQSIDKDGVGMGIRFFL